MSNFFSSKKNLLFSYSVKVCNIICVVKDILVNFCLLFIQDLSEKFKIINRKFQILKEESEKGITKLNLEIQKMKKQIEEKVQSSINYSAGNVS